MQYEKFIGEVQNRARLSSRSEAVKATRATLEVLGQRLHGGGADNLAAQLPGEVGIYLKQSDPSETFDLDEFFERVKQKERLDFPNAVHHSRVVISVLKEAVSAGEIEDVQAQLSDDYDALFDSGSEGEM